MTSCSKTSIRAIMQITKWINTSLKFEALHIKKNMKFFIIKRKKIKEKKDMYGILISIQCYWFK